MAQKDGCVFCLLRTLSFRNSYTGLSLCVVCAVENFYAFREFLETTKLAKGQPKRDMDLVIPDFALTVTGAPGEVTGGRGRLDASEISALAKRMAIDSSLIKDRRLGLRTYRDAILGS